jgi:hypothetical protein
MWYWLTATAKAHATPETISAKRHLWVKSGQDGQLAARCRSAKRYVVEGASPPTVFWLVETEDPDAVGLITAHFGDLWDIAVREVTLQAVTQAVK